MAGARITRAANRQRWRDHIEGWRASGLNQQAYCTQHDLSVGSFRRWRRIFDDSISVSESSPVAGGFIPVRLMAEPQSGSGLAVMINDTLRIEVAAGFDASTLRRLVAALG